MVVAFAVRVINVRLLRVLVVHYVNLTVITSVIVPQ